MSGQVFKKAGMLLSVFGAVVLFHGAAYSQEFKTSAAVQEMLGNYFGSSAPEAVEKAADAVVPVSAPVETMTSDWSADDLYINGSQTFDMFGSTLSLKIAFTTGTYDSYSQQYSAKPYVSFSNISDRANVKLYGSDSGSIYDGMLFKADAENVHVEVYTDTIHYHPPFNTSVTKVFAAWRSFATRFCGQHLGRTICFVPQESINPDSETQGFTSGGYVVSQGSPTSPATNLPQDFIELYRYENGIKSFKPKAYSIPLHITLTRSEDYSYMTLTDMTEADLAAAMREASSGTSKFVPYAKPNIRK